MFLRNQTQQTDILNSIIAEHYTVLAEGGLGGHLKHLYENPDLTFGELKSILTQASRGKLEKTTEKLDGQNIFFSFNVADNSLRFARNKGDLKRGGMNKDEVDRKWFDKPAVQQTFSSAFQILDEAVKTLSQKDKVNLFGKNADIWYSAEILATVNPNVINYDRNVIIPHEFGVQRLTSDGTFDPDFNAAPQFEKLRSTIGRLQQTASQKGWTIMEPIIYPLKALGDKSALKTVLGKINQEMSRAKLSDSSTIGDFIVARLAAYMAGYGITPEVASLIGKRLLNTPDKPARINLIRKYLKNEEEYIKVVALDRKKMKIFKDIINPIELAISDFAVDLLKGAESLVALHPDKTVQTMKSQVEQAINALQANKGDTEFLSNQLAKLRGLDNVTSSMEGIVFRYKGTSYKLTGAFAPINQILGAFKFGGRGGTADDEEGFVLNNVSEGVRKVSVFPGAFKPFHRGHYRVVQLAAAQSSELYLLVSTKDRIKSGELPLMGAASMEMWKKYIEPILPKNVKVQYVENPVSAVFDVLKKLDTEPKSPKVYLIAGAEDVDRFNPKALAEGAPNLSTKNMIEVVDVPRFGDISGTDARATIFLQDKEQFKNMLPPPLAKYAEPLFNLFYKSGMEQVRLKQQQQPPKKVKTAVAPKVKAKPTRKMSLRELKAFIKEVLKETKI